jgi:hypothetical protein
MGHICKPNHCRNEEIEHRESVTKETPAPEVGKTKEKPINPIPNMGHAGITAFVLS